MVIQLLTEMSTRVQDAATSPTLPLPPPPPPPAAVNQISNRPRRATPPSSFRRCGLRDQCGTQKAYCCLATCNNNNNSANCRTSLIRNCNGGKACSNNPSSKYYCCPYYDCNVANIPTAPMNGLTGFPGLTGFTGLTTLNSTTAPLPDISIFPDLTMSGSNSSPVVNNSDFTNIDNSKYQCSAITAPLSSYMFDTYDENKEHGCFRKSVPTMPLFISVFLCIFNFFLPGTGTLLASITIIFGCSTEYGKDQWKKAFVISLLAAILQIVSAIFVIGWVWSVMWGINFIKNSTKMKNPKHMYSMNI